MGVIQQVRSVQSHAAADSRAACIITCVTPAYSIIHCAANLVMVAGVSTANTQSNAAAHSGAPRLIANVQRSDRHHHQRAPAHGAAGR
jgi:hypothetical protein